MRNNLARLSALAAGGDAFGGGYFAKRAGDEPVGPAADGPGVVARLTQSVVLAGVKAKLLGSRKREATTVAAWMDQPELMLATPSKVRAATLKAAFRVLTSQRERDALKGLLWRKGGEAGQAAVKATEATVGGAIVAGVKGAAAPVVATGEAVAATGGAVAWLGSHLPMVLALTGAAIGAVALSRGKV